jgi:hypothetical protein
MSYNDLVSTGDPVKVTIFVLDGDWTPDPLMKSAVIELQGGGGASAQSPATGAGQCSAASGGAGGAYVRVRVTRAELLASPLGLGPRTVAVGQAGTGTGPGLGGGASSVQGIATADGGASGSATSVFPIASGAMISGPAGVNPAPPTIGTLEMSLKGRNGSHASVMAVGKLVSMRGANSMMGVGGGGNSTNHTWPGNSPHGFGSAPSGNANINASPITSGIVGKQGRVLIIEHL